MRVLALYSQRGGIHNNLVGIKNLCVERHAPGLVANGTAAVLTRGGVKENFLCGRKGSEKLPIHLLLAAIALATLLQAHVLTFGNPSAPPRPRDSSIGE